jgi:cbb3-type cytochrome c oxidase subunit III
MRLLTVSIIIVFAVAVPSFAQSDNKNAGKGQEIFQEQCVGCHGPDGHAQTDMGKKVGAADLTSDAVQHQSDSQLEKVVKNGKKKMPSFGEKLSEDDIHGLIAYVRQLGKTP